MLSIALTGERYAGWDQFCLESKDAWFWHTTDWLEYSLNYRPDLHSQQHSFMVEEDGRILAICPIFEEDVATPDGQVVKELSVGGSPAPAPAVMPRLNTRRRKSVLDYVFREVDGLARRVGALRVSFYISPLITRFLEALTLPDNFLLRYGFIDLSLSTQVVDLSLSQEQLWDGLRRSHRRCILKAERIFTCEVFDQNTITKPVFDAYRKMHHKAAGRVTRPLITFEMMYNWICEGKAVLFRLRQHGHFVGFELYVVYKDRVYGGSACNDPDCDDLPIRHLIEWKAINWFKVQGHSFYEVGIQEYGPQLHDIPSKKQQEISHFKRGFGGYAVPRFAGEKFYSPEYCRRVFQARLDRYCAAIPWQELGSGAVASTEAYTELLEQGVPAEVGKELQSEPAALELYNQVAGRVDPRLAATWIVGTLLHEARCRGLNLCADMADSVCELLLMVQNGQITDVAATQVLQVMLDQGGTPGQVVAKLNLAKADSDHVTQVLEAVICDNTKIVSDYLGGNNAAINALVGRAVQATQGRVDPRLLRQGLQKRLKRKVA